MEKGHVCICWWVFRLPIFPKVQPGVISFLTWGNSHLHNLRCSSCNGDPGFGIERSSLFEQWVLAPDWFLQVYWGRKKSHLLHCDSINWRNIFVCSENKNHLTMSHHRLRVVLSQDSRANCFRQKSLKRVFVTTAVCFIHATRFQTPARLNLITGESRHPTSDLKCKTTFRNCSWWNQRGFCYCWICWCLLNPNPMNEKYFTTVGGLSLGPNTDAKLSPRWDDSNPETHQNLSQAKHRHRRQDYPRSGHRSGHRGGPRGGPRGAGGATDMA